MENTFIISRKIISLIVIIICLYYSIKSLDSDVVMSKEMYLLSTKSYKYSYDIITENTMICDLSTVSNIILSMKADGYELIDYNCKEELIDLKLKGKGTVNRIVYTREGKFTNISAPYEKSYIPMTYIDEKM